MNFRLEQPQFWSSLFNQSKLSFCILIFISTFTNLLKLIQTNSRIHQIQYSIYSTYLKSTSNQQVHLSFLLPIFFSSSKSTQNHKNINAKEYLRQKNERRKKWLGFLPFVWKKKDLVSYLLCHHRRAEKPRGKKKWLPVAGSEDEEERMGGNIRRERAWRGEKATARDGIAEKKILFFSELCCCGWEWDDLD